MSYKKYINYSLKGLMMGSLVVGSFLQMDEKVAKAAYEEGETPTFEEDGIIYITPEATKEAGQMIFSDPNWITGLDNHSSQQEVPLNQKLSASQYKDYDSNAYWAKDMKWAIDQGLITGYQNQKHPTEPSKGLGNWLDPTGNLTEFQMLSVMLRYKDRENFESAKVSMKDKTASNFAYVEYHFANKHGITTKGSMTNAIPAKQQVTRGQMAQALVSMHYGKTVTLQQAVDFMYANGLTTGKDPSRGQTVANFDANGKLVRAHIVAFMGRYNELVIAGDIKDTLNNPADYSIVPTPPKGLNNNNSSVVTVNPSAPKFEHTKYDYSNLLGKFDTTKSFEFKDYEVYISGGTTVTISSSSSENVVIDDALGDKGERVKMYTGKVINTSYPNHTYNVKSQEEYDQVMNHVHKLLEGKTYLYTKMYNPSYYNNDEEAFRQDEIFDLNVLERLMDGSLKVINDRKDPAFRTDENIKANGLNISYGDAIKQGVSFDTLAKFRAADWYVSFFTGLSETSQSVSDQSAYGYFIKKESNTLSSAYAEQAIFDALGYNTAVVHSNYDYLIVELDGQWYKVRSGLKEFNKDSVLKSEFIKFAPKKHADKLDFIKIM